MLVHYVSILGEPLLSRPQTAVPREGERVTLHVPGAGLPPTRYLVVDIAWHLVLPADGCGYYSLTDAPQEDVHVVLREE